MATQEIKSTDWKKFCERFQRLHNGQLITIELINLAGYRQPIADRLPLRNIRFEQTKGCSDRMFVVVGQEGTREISHEIIEPIHVKIREEGEGSKALQIDAESGSTLISFTSGKIAELLDGLQD